MRLALDLPCSDEQYRLAPKIPGKETAAGGPEMGFQEGWSLPQRRLIENASFSKGLGEKIKAPAVRCAGIA
jgi:hypothetical protein